MSPTAARTGAEPFAGVAWGLAGALCGGAAWAVGLRMGMHFFGVNLATIGADEIWQEDSQPFALLAAGVGCTVGLVFSLFLRRQGWGLAEWAVAVAAWAVGLAVATGLGAVLSVVAVAETQGWIRPEIASALGFSVTGFLAAFGAFAWTRWTAGRSDFGRSAIVGLGWGLAGAAGTAGVWAVGLLLAKHLLQTDATVIFSGDLHTLPFIAAGFGAAWGLVVAVLGCVPIGRRSWLRAERFADVLAWCLGLPLAAAVGGALGVLAVIATEGRVWPEVASSLGFSVAGLLTGVGAYAWSHRRSEPPDDPEPDDEEGWQAAGPGNAGVPPERGPLIPAVVLRLLPVWLVSASSLIAALAVRPSHLAFAFLAVAVLGGVTGATLWSQELRIGGLERQLRGRRKP
jgi:hypothetical protein